MGDEPGFRVLGASTLCDAGFLAVERLHVAGPDGEEFDRHVVRHPGAVVVVPVIANPDGGSDALLVRQWRVATGGDLLEVPAGKRDVDGEAPEVTANRELEEEIGYRAGRLDLLCEFYNSPGFCDEYTYLFLATELEARDARRGERGGGGDDDRAGAARPGRRADRGAASWSTPRASSGSLLAASVPRDVQ